MNKDEPDAVRTRICTNKIVIPQQITPVASLNDRSNEGISYIHNIRNPLMHYQLS